ncbi:hypothetical protein HZB05_01225 [Candidatus Wolfebacteria bacterium]|nr:hypothetical protein [Candidatus Wolfebacteria bacterium]
MEKYSKFSDINAVLKKAKDSIDKIEKEYNKSLTAQNISDDLLVDIKDYLGNLRSSLDYLRSKVSKHKFPICKTEKEFDNSTTDLSNEVKNTIKKWQPFQGNDWISWFNLLNNKSKHLTLIPQIRKEMPQLNISGGQAGISLSGGASISIGRGASISIGGATIPGGQIISPNHNFIHDKRLQVEKIIWVNFEFDNSNCSELPSGISALPFLKQCFEKIAQAVSEIESVIG